MTRFGYPPTVVTSKEASKGATTPTPQSTRDRLLALQRKAEKDRKWPIRGWDVPDEAEIDGGLCGWIKRKTALEAKGGGKKRQSCINEEHYIPMKYCCPSIEDAGQYRKDSLHETLLPQSSNTAKKTGSSKPLFKFTTSGLDKGQSSNPQTYGVITPSGFEEIPELGSGDVDHAQAEILSYRDAKINGHPLDRRSKSVMDSTSKSRQLERSNTYQKIRRLLKFSSSERKPLKSDDEDDEGYSSKTSSAEAANGDNRSEESNLEQMAMMSNSMVNLSELPSSTLGTDSESVKPGVGLSRENTRFKFNYTHQPTILQLPDPEMKMINSRVHVLKKLETEDTGLTYAKLKRSKEFSRCYPPEPEAPPPECTIPEGGTLYDIENMKPVTLILRKISIQNSDENTTSITPPVLWNSQENRGLPRGASISPSRIGSARSPVGSPKSRVASATSRCGSAVSRTSSTMSQTDIRSKLNKRSNNNSHSDASNNTKQKEPMWNQQFSLIERQATSYCIGDLLPAVDKSIYTTNSFTNSKLGNISLLYKSENYSRSDVHGSTRSGSADDGNMLLKKGMEILTGGMDKPTLGPPPFRPNQTRHPLIRNVTVVVSSNQQPGSNRSSPIQTESGKGKVTQPRVQSDRGPRPSQASADKETQRKLKEAFTKFYQNRPQDVGKEFRRVQSMWNT